jgi:dUTP pyrophosphatase
MIRGFKEVNLEFKKHEGNTILPIRGSKKSAGHDFHSKETVTINPGESHLFWTDIKAYMMEGEVLEMYVRSSIGIKKNLILKNLVGIIDSDYYNNPQNDGNVGIALFNIGKEPQQIEIGERIAQGIFKSFLEVDNFSNIEAEDRIGGLGSSGRF